MATGTFKFQADLALCLRCCLKVFRRFQMFFKPRPCSPSSLQLLKRLHSSSSRRSRDGCRQTDLTAKTHLIDIWYRMIHSILIPVYHSLSMFISCSDAFQIFFQISFSFHPFGVQQKLSSWVKSPQSASIINPKFSCGEVRPHWVIHMALADGYRDVVLKKHYISTPWRWQKRWILMVYVRVTVWCM